MDSQQQDTVNNNTYVSYNIYPKSIMEECERRYNISNETFRALSMGFPNSTREQFLEECMARNAGIFISHFIIIPYALIFLLSVSGNSLVILTLVRHKKMRTITNVYLLNLAISDLLLAVFCMPFTLISNLMQRFIFGSVVCFLIRYAQAVSVGVSCFTLVAISIERFYAICQPLRSRKWQTLKHSYRVILSIWLAAMSIMIPIAVFNKIINLQNGVEACRELWPSHLLESMYMVLLNIVLLVIPLFLMAFSYARIAKELWSEVSISSVEPSSPLSESDQQRNDGKDKQNGFTTPIQQSPLIPRKHIARSVSSESSNGKVQVLHPTYNVRVLANKKRVVKMLCVVVLEYFVCWTPLYVVNSWTVLDYPSARIYFTLLTKSILLSLAYLSSCIHPITYCFMNRRFRQSFADAFKCCTKRRFGRSFFYSEASQNNCGSEIVKFSNPRIGRNIKITWRKSH